MAVIIDDVIGIVEPPAAVRIRPAAPAPEPRRITDPEPLSHALRRMEQRLARLRAD